MQTYAIVELEEGTLNVIVGGRDGATTRVQRSLRIPCADLGYETVSTVLRSIGSDVWEGAGGVHVVLGERRMQHFQSTLPKMTAPEVVAFVTREGMRLSAVQTQAEALVATRLVRRLPGKKLVMGTTALARSVWEPIRRAFESNNIKVAGLYSMETCLAMAAKSPDGDPVAIIECNAGRARFVLCEAESPVQVRRFLIGGGGEGNAAAMTTQLAMELPRTLDWLREIGQALPKALVLGARVNVEDESMEMLRGDDLQTIVRGEMPAVVADGQATPSLGVAALIARLGSGKVLPSLLEVPRLHFSLGASRVVALAATVAAGLACSLSAIVDGKAWITVQDVVEETRAETQRLQAAVAADESVPVGNTQQRPEDVRLQTALTMRRPISLLLAQVSNAAEGGLHLEELKFASTDRIVVTGIVEGSSRQQALAALTVFSKRLRDLPYLRADGQDESGEVAGQRNRFRFRLGMAWRNS